MDGERVSKSKVDDVLAALPPHESDLLRAWLHDPKGWTSFMISKTLHDYSTTEGKDFTMGHGTIDRWRIINGIPNK